jgi:predicted ArsR family transcriptional regulator
VDLIEQVEDVLAQPTRARLFRLLEGLDHPTSTAELAERLNKHPNGIRLHLERMAAAGLVSRQAERNRRGRPRDLWSVVPDASPGTGPPTAYVELSQWLARAVGKGVADPEGIESFARRIGRDLAAGDDSSSPPEDRFNAALAGMGFQPSHERTDEGRVTFCLNNCPYRDTVKGQQAVICGLHRGISAGLLESIAPEASLERFAPKDPEEAGCQIEVSGLPTDSAG